MIFNKIQINRIAIIYGKTVLLKLEDLLLLKDKELFRYKNWKWTNQIVEKL